MLFVGCWEWHLACTN